VVFAQDGRFKIVEDYGCSSSLAPTWVTIVIVAVPPILLELIAGVYGCLSIRAFYKRRSQLNESFSSHPNFNSNRYMRLMCFSALDLFIGTPFSAVYLCFSITELTPYPGFSPEYQHISEVTQLPAVVWRATTIHELTFELRRWIVVWGVIVFFVIFGFTEESRNNYRAIVQSVVQGFIMITGIKTRSRPSSNAERSAHPLIRFSFFLFLSDTPNVLFRITFKTKTSELPVDTSNSRLVELIAV
jgi:pheromone a factor receptor